MHLCMGAYGEHSSRLRNFEGFKLVTNLKETKEAKCKECYSNFASVLKMVAAGNKFKRRSDVIGI